MIAADLECWTGLQGWLAGLVPATCSQLVAFAEGPQSEIVAESLL